MSADQRAKGEKLSPYASIYRALRPSWIDLETGLPLAIAFMLREDEGEEDGISVSESVENAVRPLRTCAGYSVLSVQRVRQAKYESGAPLEAEVVADPDEMDPDHALIKGAPLWAPKDTPDYERQQLFADRLIAEAVETTIQKRFKGGVPVS